MAAGADISGAIARPGVALAAKFFQEAGRVLMHILTLAETDMVLVVLSLIDIVLVGSLIVIVAISSIHLLRVFMDVEDTPNGKIVWYVVLHLTFVALALLLGVLDRIAFAAHRDS